MCQLKSLIFDCLSFIEGLITLLSTAHSETPTSGRTFVTSVCPSNADWSRAVMPKNNKYKHIFKYKHFLIKSSQATQFYTTTVFYKQFSCHHDITINFRRKSC